MAAEGKKKAAGSLANAASRMGKVGGPARKAALTPQRRTEIARQGGRARQKGTAKQRGR